LHLGALVVTRLPIRIRPLSTGPTPGSTSFAASASPGRCTAHAPLRAPSP
jgi:hypothetical protein